MIKATPRQHAVAEKFHKNGDKNICSIDGSTSADPGFILQVTAPLLANKEQSCLTFLLYDMLAVDDLFQQIVFAEHVVIAGFKTYA